jgi:hypothetical protein
MKQYTLIQLFKSPSGGADNKLTTFEAESAIEAIAIAFSKCTFTDNSKQMADSTPYEQVVMSSFDLYCDTCFNADTAIPYPVFRYRQQWFDDQGNMLIDKEWTTPF